MAGKGDGVRPRGVPYETWSDNYDRIFKKCREAWVEGVKYNQELGFYDAKKESDEGQLGGDKDAGTV